MEFQSQYVAHIPDEKGFVEYSFVEQQVWNTLYQRQIELIKGRACNEFIYGLDALGLSAACIPQLPEVNGCLHKLTGWQVKPVKALISAREFFELLAERCFPAATFIRTEEDLDYIQEPDIFHELFGHCPMLTNPIYADFMQQYAQKVLEFSEKDWPLLQRLFWFTVEFGLIRTSEGLKAYGGGILSSSSETVYSVESEAALRAFFEPVSVFRMPYRIDRIQPVYFVIDDYQQLYQFVQSEIAVFIEKARALGEYPPYFTVEGANPSIHIRAC